MAQLNEANNNIFILGEQNNTDLCAGTLFDSGGEFGDYGVKEDAFFTICPTLPSQCISIEVVQFDIEADYDFLYLHEGSSTNGALIAEITGRGFQTLAFSSSKCITVRFTSDNSQNRAGFQLQWQCSEEVCPENEESTCTNPNKIEQIPFTANDLTTCFAGNNLESGICGDDDFLKGKEYILAYDSPGGECISVAVKGLIGESGIAIFRNCPVSETAFCINQKQGSEFEEYLVLPNITLREKGTYYFVVANQFNCTPFSIEITPSDNCPIVFPSAATCEKGLILNGCNPDLPAAITVESGTGNPDFFQLGVNNGCWDNVRTTNFTWFTFEAQGDGEFAFLLSNNDPNEVVDIDFNIWGPFEGLANACGGSENNQPIRSSWADDSEYSITGLANNNPALGTIVTETCEGIDGEGFVKPLSVKKGEVYVVLINDFDGVIYSGAVAIDFSGSDPVVLAAIESSFSQVQDTFICIGDSLQLSASGASAYEWSPSESLSCRTCPNPIASPLTTTTYTLKASTVCQTVTDTFTIEVVQANAGNDQTICQGDTVALTANPTSETFNYHWMNVQNNPLSCTNCPSPNLSAINSGNFEYILVVDNGICFDTSTIAIEVVPNEVLIESNANKICTDETVQLSTAVPDGAEYLSWTPSNDLSCSDCSNPEAYPVKTTTFQLGGSYKNCPFKGTTTIEVTNFQNTQLINKGDSEVFIGQKVDSIFLMTDLEYESIVWLENDRLIERANDTILNYFPLTNEPISSENRIVNVKAQITTIEGCEFITSIDILVKPPTIPNVFTPGNDGANDFFNVLIPESEKVITTFQVYNRWGKLVYDNNEPTRGWNGRMHNNGDALPVGVYLYFIQYEIDNKIETFKGNVTLIR